MCTSVFEYDPSHAFRYFRYILVETMGDKFCLKWNEFQENLSSTFSGWRNTGDAFTDVTLACDNDQFVESHKIVLSAASPFFMNLLQRTKKQQHPLIYLRGVEAKDLASVLDFIYHGQANVYQEDLQSFLTLAQELQLKGLQEAGGDEGKEGKGERRLEKKRKREDFVDPSFSEEGGSVDNGCSSDQSEVVFKMEQDHELDSSKGWALADQGEDGAREEEIIRIPEEYPVRYPGVPVLGGHDPGMKVFLSGEGGLEELNMQIAALMEMGEDNVWTCKVCGKKATKGGKPEMRYHIEANHMEGVSHCCKICGKAYKLVFNERELFNRLAKPRRCVNQVHCTLIKCLKAGLICT